MVWCCKILQNGVCSPVKYEPSMCVSDVGLSGFSSIVSERIVFNPSTTNRLQTREWILGSCSPYRPIETHGKSTMVPCTTFHRSQGFSPHPQSHYPITHVHQSTCMRSMLAFPSPIPISTYLIPRPIPAV